MFGAGEVWGAQTRFRLQIVAFEGRVRVSHPHSSSTATGGTSWATASSSSDLCRRADTALGGLRRAKQQSLGATDLDTALVADAEVMRDLVEDDPSDLAAEASRVGT
jgi:hypothetical protein